MNFWRNRQTEDMCFSLSQFLSRTYLGVNFFHRNLDKSEVLTQTHEFLIVFIIRDIHY